MKKSLHIITRPLTTEEEGLIRQEQEEVRVEMAQLTEPDADYDALVSLIFDADSIRVW